MCFFFISCRKTPQSALEMNTTANRDTTSSRDITANQAYGSVSTPQLCEEIDYHGDVYTEIQPKEHEVLTEGNLELSEYLNTQHQMHSHEEEDEEEEADVC